MWIAGELLVGYLPEDITSVSIVTWARGDSDIGIESCHVNASILYRK